MVVRLFLLIEVCMIKYNELFLWHMIEVSFSYIFIVFEITQYHSCNTFFPLSFDILNYITNLEVMVE